MIEGFGFVFVGFYRFVVFCQESWNSLFVCLLVVYIFPKDRRTVYRYPACKCPRCKGVVILKKKKTCSAKWTSDFFVLLSKSFLDTVIVRNKNGRPVRFLFVLLFIVYKVISRAGDRVPFLLSPFQQYKLSNFYKSAIFWHRLCTTNYKLFAILSFVFDFLSNKV